MHNACPDITAMKVRYGEALLASVHLERYNVRRREQSQGAGLVRLATTPPFPHMCATCQDGGKAPASWHSWAAVMVAIAQAVCACQK
jgi:hypothetical protein